MQDRQILHVDDFCNECDNCQTFCVHHGRPYADKPRLFLDAEAFAAEADNAFHITGRSIHRREGGRFYRLVVDQAVLRYDDPELTVTLTPDWRVTDAVARAPFEGLRSLRLAAEMAILHQGVTAGLPFLLIA